MKNRVEYLVLTFFMIFISCGTSDENIDSGNKFDWRCGTHNGNELWTGERGGCYYINSNGNKTYVDRSECNC